MITIPLTRWRGFHHTREDGRRLGQHFHDYMEFEKVTDKDLRVWCDALYNAKDVTARQMIMVNLDRSC